jgi:hypothetical protein
MSWNVLNQRGPSGEIELSYKSEQTHNGAEDKTRSAKLIVADDSVVLVTEYHYDTGYDFSKTADTVNRYKISPEDLIDLVKKHGTRVAD